MFRHWAPKAPLQTLTANSLVWAEKKPSLDCDEAIPGRERLSFAANQPVSGNVLFPLLPFQVCVRIFLPILFSTIFCKSLRFPMHDWKHGIDSADMKFPITSRLSHSARREI
ncbi:hypothetical protein SAY87_020794 [Trapa incisa]|uniref:Uncharacterized protein n=1 Tax=Trapa incisa TaxID=236973 RepID=A0AAN7PPU7_9MYRT|nr:hypothetical protein SAY87_020794 [Trapa incisa]